MLWWHKVVTHVQDALVHSRRVSWAQDRFAGGGDAHVLPGHAAARAVLAQPDGRVFFAGEALGAWPQTVHGAVDSGVRTAQACMGAGFAHAKL